MLEPSYGMALVTGASGGIGKEFAIQLSHRGWDLILVGRNEERLEETRRSLDGRRAESSIAIKADLSDRGAGVALHADCRKRGYAVELLVNDAGSGLFGHSTALPAERIGD